MESHYRTLPARIRILAENMTGRRGSFTAEEVFQVANLNGLRCSKVQVTSALKYATRSDTLVYRGKDWYYWKRKAPKTNI